LSTSGIANAYSILCLEYIMGTCVVGWLSLDEQFTKYHIHWDKAWFCEYNELQCCEKNYMCFMNCVFMCQTIWTNMKFI
jgi:hypothetical protein